MSASPSRSIVHAAMTAVTVQDPAGRALAVRRMTALDRLRLFKAVGPVLSQNDAYLGMALLASSVTEIDGVPVPAPATEGQLEALVARLGDAGIGAVADALAAEMPAAASEGSTTQGN